MTTIQNVYFDGYLKDFENKPSVQFRILINSIYCKSFTCVSFRGNWLFYAVYKYELYKHKKIIGFLIFHFDYNIACFTVTSNKFSLVI